MVRRKIQKNKQFPKSDIEYDSDGIPVMVERKLSFKEIETTENYHTRITDTFSQLRNQVASTREYLEAVNKNLETYLNEIEKQKISFVELEQEFVSSGPGANSRNDPKKIDEKNADNIREIKRYLSSSQLGKKNNLFKNKSTNN